MPGAIIPILANYDVRDAETLSEPFIKAGDYSSRTRDPNFQLTPDAIIGMQAVRITQDQEDAQIDHVICLSPQLTSDLQGEAEAFMQAYEDNVGTLQNKATEQIELVPAAEGVLNAITKHAIERTSKRGLKNIASIVVMRTTESFTSGLVVPRNTLEDVCLNLRDMVVDSRLRGRQEESLPEGVSQEEFDRTIQIVLAQDPGVYHAGMLAMARLFPSVGLVQNIVDQYLASRFIQSIQDYRS